MLGVQNFSRVNQLYEQMIFRIIQYASYQWQIIRLGNNATKSHKNQAMLNQATELQASLQVMASYKKSITFFKKNNLFSVTSYL